MAKIYQFPVKDSIQVKPGFTLTVGERIYNHGDMANAPKFGTIIEIKRPERFSPQVIVKWDERYNKRDSCLMTCEFSEKFLGVGSTRIVKESAYTEWREAQINAIFNRRNHNG